MNSIRKDFTLLELLIVAAILASVAFVAGGAFVGVTDQANDGLVRGEMNAIAKAIRQFKQDTGYYPKTGPFALVSDGGLVTSAMLPDSADADEEAWFYSPANMYQLYGSVSPLDANQNGDADSGEHMLTYLDQESGRGWNGPYLQGHIEGYVTMSAAMNSSVDGEESAGDRDGLPSAGTLIESIPAVADPFDHSPDNSDYLEWRSQPSAEPLRRWGRPYLVFDLNESPVLVSMGSDGIYNNDDDVVLNIEGFDNP